MLPWIKLHCAVVLFALAGLFAKWLVIPAYFLVLGRTGFAAAFSFTASADLAASPSNLKSNSKYRKN